jgi:Na+-driven multidrug efflux pump
MFSIFDANRLFLNAMEISHVATIILAIGLPFHCILAYFLVLHAGWGIFGLAIAINITYTGYLMAISSYSCLTKKEDVREAWFWPNNDSLKDWGTIFELGVPSSVMYFVDWSSFEIIALMSGLLGVVELSTVGVICVCAPFFESFGFGMQMTVVVFISNAIGAQKI